MALIHRRSQHQRQTPSRTNQKGGSLVCMSVGRALSLRILIVAAVIIVAALVS
jgi:hypothetical protein